jgi:hypothetical protein
MDDWPKSPSSIRFIPDPCLITRLRLAKPQNLQTAALVFYSVQFSIPNPKIRDIFADIVERTTLT